MRRAICIVLLLATCALAAPAVAESRPMLVAPTKVTLLEVGENSIEGKLESPAAGCTRHRVIRVTTLQGGTLVATARTDRTGRFSIGLDGVPQVEGDGIRVQTWWRLGLPFCRGGFADLGFDYATLSGGPHGGSFSGVLNSSVTACEVGRLITLYEVGSDPVPVGFDDADANGAWEIAAAGGTYEVRADRTLVSQGNAYTVCREVSSFPWYYEEPVEEQEP